MYQTVEVQSIICVPRSVFSCNSCVPVVCHAGGVKMGPVKFAKVISSKKAKDLLVVKGLNFIFQRILTDKKERWFCINGKCKCYTKCNDSRKILGGNVMQSHDGNREACLNRQIFNP